MSVDISAVASPPVAMQHPSIPKPRTVIDLTDSSDDHIHHKDDAVPQAPSRSSQPSPKRDHMHSVVDLLHHELISNTAAGSPRIRKEKKTQRLDPKLNRNRTLASRHLKPSGPKGLTEKAGVQPRTLNHQAHTDHGAKTFLSPFRGDVYDILQGGSSDLSPHSPDHVLGQHKRRKEKEKETVTGPFPFRQLPPEIRNAVYHLLLTTPNTPIELPRLTRNAAARAAQWRKCKSVSQRKQFKSLFLEILQTCKQMHDEASGILYGCNVFKFRSDYKQGPQPIVLPTRHLHLLKHIKISVISSEDSIGHEGWVADLLNGFRTDEMRLDTFEMTWFGWKRFCLRKGGAVSQALQTLSVDRQMIVKVTGEARMEKDMLLELEQNIQAKEIEIHRPVKQVSGGETVEFSDDEAGAR
ncbi:hypothetical protein MMC07_006932 [Pseudocyphellaria aurata]|nr:hypothetical protein [Pseudocyphellaria aurata]